MSDTNTTEPSIAVTVNITEKRIGDLLCCAFEGGISYWACIIGYRINGQTSEGNEPPAAPLPQYPYLSLPLMEGGAVILADREEVPRGQRKVPKSVKRFALDREAIQKGLNLMSKKFPAQFGNFASENEDATTGDIFVQLALFGEIVYG